jgi:hypothetical protein
MKVLTILSLAVSFTLISNISVFAQVSKNATENRTSDLEGGYSFNVPKGWTKKEGEGGFALVNSSQTIIIAVKAHNYKDFKAFMADANLERDGLKQIGETKDVDDSTKYFRTAAPTLRGVLVVDTLVLFSPHGGGVAIASLTDDKNAETGLRGAIEVADTILFSKPQESPANKEWQNLLRGKHLIYYYSGNGYSERRDIWLCSSGNFYMSFDGSSLSGMGSGAVGANNRGSWRVTSAGSAGSQLILQFQNGQTRQYNLNQRQSTGEIFLDNNRYFVKSHNECN